MPELSFASNRTKFKMTSIVNWINPSWERLLTKLNVFVCDLVGV